MNCLDCNHPEHEPGKCKHDNCGQSGLAHPTSPLTPRDLKIEPRRESFNSSSTERYGYNKGRRVKRKRTDND